MNDKAEKIQKMEEHKIPLEELTKRLGAKIETGLSN